MLAAKRRPGLVRDLLAPAHQPGAGSAAGHLVAERVERPSARDGHGGIVRREPPVPCAAVRVLLLVNATASSVTPRKRVVLRKELSTRHEVEVAETSRRGHATRLAHAAANDGFDVVAVLAGDGTLNEAADGLAGTSTALAPLPGGSTNVYARTLGVPVDLGAATSVLLASLERRSFRRTGVGLASGRRFLFNCGVGFDAAVIRRVERYGELKRYVSHPLHVVAAFETWFRHYDHADPRFDITIGSEHIDGCYFAIVTKTSPYTYLGPRPIHVAPEATLDTPLSVTAFQRFDAPTLIGAAVSAMRSRKFIERRRGIVHRAGIERLTVTGRTDFPYQVDGDDLGDTAGLDIAYEPDAITVVLP
jgi:diacylglycerol kinase family enzyme